MIPYENYSRKRPSPFRVPRVSLTRASTASTQCALRFYPGLSRYRHGIDAPLGCNFSGCTRRGYFIFPWQSPISRQFFAGNHRTGWITSPEFPSDYSDNTVCIWVLKLLPGTQAKVTFKSFRTGESVLDDLDVFVSF